MDTFFTTPAPEPRLHTEMSAIIAILLPPRRVGEAAPGWRVGVRLDPIAPERRISMHEAARDCFIARFSRRVPSADAHRPEISPRFLGARISSVRTARRWDGEASPSDASTRVAGKSPIDRGRIEARALDRHCNARAFSATDPRCPLW